MLINHFIDWLVQSSKTGHCCQSLKNHMPTLKHWDKYHLCAIMAQSSKEMKKYQ